MHHYAGYLYIFLAAACWGLTGSVSRFVLADGMQPLEAAFWRAALGAAFFLAHAKAANTLRRPGGRDLAAFALFGAISLGGFFGSYQYAIQTGGAALAAVLLYTAPAWVAVSSRLFFNEHITVVKIAAIGLSLAGVACISLSGLGGGASAPGVLNIGFTGILFGLLAGFLYSTHYIFTTKYLACYSPHALYGYAMLFGALTLLPFIDFSAKSAQDWLVVCVLGLVCTYAAYLAYCAGLQRLAPTRAAVLATFEPVVATVSAWWLWNENFAPTGWIGAGLILTAVLILVLGSKQDRAGT